MVALASYGVSHVAPPPQNGSAAKLLHSIHAGAAFVIPTSSGYALLSVKGHPNAREAVGVFALPTPPCPPGSSLPAGTQVSHHRLFKPYCGRIGIGTTEPEGNLDIVGDEGSIPLRVSNKGGEVALYVRGGEVELVGQGTLLSAKQEEGGGETIAEFFRYTGGASVLLQWLRQ